MTDEKNSNKRIVKNTFLLYVRTFVTMAIGLFTSRVILENLGVEDYGIYNIVGGFVSTFSIISGCLVGTTQRYLTFELGKKNNSVPQKIFGIAMNIHFAIAIVLFLLFETIGLWFLNNRLNIPSERISAANWAYHCSILAFIINIISIPYNAIIIAHERMKTFAYIGLFDAVTKLAIAYALYISCMDRLVLYALLILGVAIVDRFIYSYYCRVNFQESKYIFVKDSMLYKEILLFASQNFFTSMASILMVQGVNIVLNIFFGVIVNAARAIATQVEAIALKFVTDFMTALNPQITKEYASGNKHASFSLCVRGCKFSYYLMFIIATPIIINTRMLLDFWLKAYPMEAIVFLRLTFVLSLLTILSSPLITIILATGNLKKNTFLIGGVRILTLPILYVVFIYYNQAYMAYWVVIVVEVVSLFIRLYVINELTGIKATNIFLKHVLTPISIVTFVSIVICYYLNKNIECDFFSFALYSILYITICIILIISVGINQVERKGFLSIVNKKIIHRK